MAYSRREERMADSLPLRSLYTISSRLPHNIRSALRTIEEQTCRRALPPVVVQHVLPEVAAGSHE
jgi:hypothetical protein